MFCGKMYKVCNTKLALQTTWDKYKSYNWFDICHSKINLFSHVMNIVCFFGKLCWKKICIATHLIIDRHLQINMIYNEWNCIDKAKIQQKSCNVAMQAANIIIHQHFLRSTYADEINSSMIKHLLLLCFNFIVRCINNFIKNGKCDELQITDDATVLSL